MEFYFTRAIAMSHTAFSSFDRVISGSLAEIVATGRADLLIFEDRTGRQIDIDMRSPPPEPRGPGRPKLGVTAREVTLLPRHWDWLSAQPGGASVALRKLVEAASRDPAHARRQARDAAYRFATAIVGDAPGYEEAMRALYAGQRDDFRHQIEGWPADIKSHLEKMTAEAF